MILACEDVRGLRSGELLNVEISDPADRNKSYCVSFQYMGGGQYDPDNWEFDQANHWQSKMRGGYLLKDEANMNGIFPNFPSLLPRVLVHRLSNLSHHVMDT